MPRARASLAATFVAPLALVGCGTEPAQRARDGVVMVSIDDFRLRPQNVRAAPGELTFRVTNVGRIPHNFRLRGIGGTRMKMATILPGRAAARTIRMSRGDWRMFCSIANHEELGLYGTLVVR